MQTGNYGGVTFKSNRPWRYVPMSEKDIATIMSQDTFKSRGVMLDRAARNLGHSTLYTLALRGLYDEELKVQSSALQGVGDNRSRRSRRQKGGKTYMTLLRESHKVVVTFTNDSSPIDLFVHRGGGRGEPYGEVKLVNNSTLAAKVYRAWIAGGASAEKYFQVAEEIPIKINWSNEQQKKVHWIWVYVLHEKGCFITYYRNARADVSRMQEKPAFLL